MAKATKEIRGTVEDEVSLISKERLEELKLEAKAKVHAEMVEKEEKKLLDQLVEEHKAELAADAEHDFVTFQLDLAPISGLYLALDGRRYYNKRPEAYVLPRRVYNVLMEMQENGWKHEAEIQGKPRTELLQLHSASRVTMVTDLRRAS